MAPAAKLRKYGSAGITSCAARSVSTGGVYAAGQISELVEKADLALYRAKAQKDSAVLYEEDFHDSE